MGEIGIDVERSGPAARRAVRVRDAGERSEERPAAGPLTVRIGGRFTNMDCIVGPPSGDPRIGRIVLKELGLIADCADRAPEPRPESPNYSLSNLKQRSAPPRLSLRWRRHRTNYGGGGAVCRQRVRHQQRHAF